ncbi:hypothetical protein GCM10011416_20010 [Polaribacter pacificus]|uniref:Uncharacterized protein n=1 Tax=Polaribacter pacificus TaxID=1775173 RepID=A0A917I0Q6_9FLAO|nr:hypothetical protein [Polaribacter pacificus]GGH01304.1 hypothetical protein GCM10011416_20010 [Polaribacter pacificus]
MNNDYKSSAFKELLDKLQQESWQLELLISGFSIFGLFSSLPFINEYLAQANYHNRLVEMFVWFAIKMCCWILIFNLLIHVVLRGLWIGALGLRYVSGDIDYEELNYTQKFTAFLQKKIGSFDKYIATLENYCSVLFAISFLLIFYFLASVAFLACILLTIFFLIESNTPFTTFNSIKFFFGGFLIIFILIGASLTFIDFITQGYLKKKRWLSVIYFPFYRFFSFISLSFLYRPLVYNFLDNKFGRKLSFILIPVYLVILVLFTYEYKDSNYLSANRSSSSTFANSKNYEDLLTEKNDFAGVATIQSRVITDPYVKIFIIYTTRIEDKIFSYNPSLKPINDIRGMQSGIEFNTPSSLKEEIKKERDSLRGVYFKTINEMHSLYIDDVAYDADFIVSTNTQKKLGFETYLSTNNLKEGKHLLRITRKEKEKQDTINKIIIQIPFWVFKQEQP